MTEKVNYHKQCCDLVCERLLNAFMHDEVAYFALGDKNMVHARASKGVYTIEYSDHINWLFSVRSESLDNAVFSFVSYLFADVVRT